MTQTIYGVVANCGDGSSTLHWFKNKPDIDAMMDEDSELWGMSEGIDQTLTFPAELDLAKCGFTFYEDYNDE